ncbi:hypothetical protein [Kaistia terrae]|uniref:Uncharacterized protein n=1 Tax=Kaistia terrae TaxID=537017 RepID=A0ABW0PVM1_9HYPH|nr:hypothetical protein [Kaistia terrae]MCX5579456.1 hypothetical protein [Kaistia terrae]
MSSWAKALKDGLQARAEGRSFVETVAIFQLDCVFATAADWAWLVEKRTEAAARGLTIGAHDGGEDTHVDLMNDTVDAFPLRAVIRVVKAPIVGVVRFFSAMALVASARSSPEAFEQSRAILVADLETSSTTAGLSIQQWTDLEPELGPDYAFRSPRKMVSDVSGHGLVPSNAATWVIPSATTDDLLVELKPTAARRLALCLPTDIIANGHGSVQCVFRGSRKVTTLVPPLGNELWSSEALSSALQEASHWVYCEAPDAETRHALLAAEIARGWPSSSDWSEGTGAVVSAALECARTAYRLHLHGKGVEALKLMSDLRKGLAEDAKAVSAQTASLSGNLWRDAAVAFAALVLKPASSGGTWLWLPAAAALYLAFSLLLTRSIADKAVDAIRSNEQTFRKNLYAPIVSKDEYDGLAGAGYSESFSSYRKFSNWIATAYILAIMVLMAQFISEPTMWVHLQTIVSHLETLLLVAWELLVEVEAAARTRVCDWLSQLQLQPATTK